MKNKKEKNIYRWIFYNLEVRRPSQKSIIENTDRVNHIKKKKEKNPHKSKVSNKTHHRQTVRLAKDQEKKSILHKSLLIN